MKLTKIAVVAFILLFSGLASAQDLNTNKLVRVIEGPLAVTEQPTIPDWCLYAYFDIDYIHPDCDINPIKFELDVKKGIFECGPTGCKIPKDCSADGCVVDPFTTKVYVIDDLVNPVPNIDFSYHSIAPAADLAVSLRQEAKSDGQYGTCLFASREYSVSGQVRMGGRVVECTKTGHWASEGHASDQNANCIYMGQEYTMGSTYVPYWNPNFPAPTCQPDGSWRQMSPAH